MQHCRYCNSNNFITIIIPPAELGGGGPVGVTLIGGVVGGLLVLMLILLLLLVVVVVCVRRRAQGKTIQDTQLQGKLFVHLTWNRSSYTHNVYLLWLTYTCIQSDHASVAHAYRGYGSLCVCVCVCVCTVAQ